MRASVGYERYGLRKNPFPHHGSFPVGDPDEGRYSSILVGREGLKGELDRRLVSLREGEGSAVLLLVGRYGMGKTHALKYLEHAAKRRYDGVIPVYVKGLRSASMLNLLSEVVRSLDSQLGREFLRDLAKAVLRRAQTRLARMPDLRAALRGVASGDTSALAWLQGAQLGRAELRRLGVIMNLDDHSAVDVLSALVDIIWGVLGRKLLILVDELDEALSASSKDQVASFYSSIRQLIDKLPEGALLVFSASEAVLRDEEFGIAALSPALESRLWGAWDVLMLGPLTGGEIREMIRRYLKAFRTPEATGMVEDEYPFTDGALSAIAEISGGIPRSALRLASICLAEGLERGFRNIDGDLVREVARQEAERVEEVRSEVRAARRRAKRAKTIEPILDEAHAKRKILEVLSGVGSLTQSELKRKAKLPKPLYERAIEALEREGLVERRKRGGGYRVYLLGGAA